MFFMDIRTAAKRFVMISNHPMIQRIKRQIWLNIGCIVEKSSNIGQKTSVIYSR
jgi:hypothetical protein